MRDAGDGREVGPLPAAGFRTPNLRSGRRDRTVFPLPDHSRRGMQKKPSAIFRDTMPRPGTPIAEPARREPRTSAAPR
jgi:hypothetical protein